MEKISAYQARYLELEFQLGRGGLSAYFQCQITPAEVSDLLGEHLFWYGVVSFFPKFQVLERGLFGTLCYFSIITVQL